VRPALRSSPIVASPRGAAPELRRHCTHVWIGKRQKSCQNGPSHRHCVPLSINNDDIDGLAQNPDARMNEGEKFEESGLCRGDFTRM
jgi:hypothetical protein